MSDTIPFLHEDVLRIMFKSLPIKDLMSCRMVSRYWQMIVDDLLEDDHLWFLGCKEDYRDTYKDIRIHGSPGLTWRDVYRSQSLWSNINDAVEEIEEFPLGNSILKQITDFQLLRHGAVSILTRTSITHFNILTKKYGPIIKGAYRIFAENNNYVIIVNYRDQLIITRKTVCRPEMLHNKTYDFRVKAFLLVDPVVYFVTFSNDLYSVKLQDDQLEMDCIRSFREQVMCMGFNGSIFILTYKRIIYRWIDGHFIITHIIKKDDDLLNILLKYDLVQNMDWLAYKQWLYCLQIGEPATGNLRDITTVRKYGKIVIIGTLWGDVLIYHVSRHNDNVSLYTQRPVKAYNLRNTGPKYLNAFPIVQVNVIEGKDKHIVVAATPYQVTAITLKHV